MKMSQLEMYTVMYTTKFIKCIYETHLSSLRMPFWLLKLNGSIAAEVPNRSSNLTSGGAWEEKTDLLFILDKVLLFREILIIFSCVE